MENKREPDPRWSEFEEVLDEHGTAIGFHLPNNEFFFRYDKDGGWEDENGKYYDHQGVLADAEEEGSVSEDSSVDDRHDDLDDDIEEMLREEEQGIVRKPKKKEEPAPAPAPEKKKEEGS